ncbi:MAG: FAD-dependent oxidoreductase [Magnetococcales bacterium]|nr:FAD-dependent oxidoreductase [Magnetococcales bacterium]
MQKHNPAGTRTLKTQVLIIGGGVTGTGVMRDLALRNISSILIDRKDLNAGASGSNHGLLHSGGRYVAQDLETAIECRIEGDILKRVAANCIDDCGGMFVAVEGDDEEFANNFPNHCQAAGIACESLSSKEARKREPSLSKNIIAAFSVPDATIDPFRLTLENVSHAQQLTKSTYLPHSEVYGFDIVDGEIVATLVKDSRVGELLRIESDQVVNAGGAWAMKIAKLAGCNDVKLLYSKGTLIISNSRMSRGVINRLRLPGDGDILVPGGTVSLLGTTSATIADPNNIHPNVDEVDRILAQGISMVPALADARFIRAFAGVRPLLMTSNDVGDGRKASRGFALFDHEKQNLRNFATVTGGKLTTFRLMAEQVGDLIAKRLGSDAKCKTATQQLPSGIGVRWTEPGFSARDWYKRQDPTDRILCECEMVPESSIDNILKEAPGSEVEMSLKAISLRSRVGKGSCQGAFCSIRVTSHLYDKGVYNSDSGLSHLRDFVKERFKGVRPVLWGPQVAQMELAEALHCALMGLDNQTNARAKRKPEQNGSKEDL